MFKFLKLCLNKKEQEIFDITIKPYIIYSIINTVFIFMAEKDIGVLNKDVSCGLFISWVTFSFIMLYIIGLKDINK